MPPAPSAADVKRESEPEPEDVAELDEAAWHANVYRGDARQLTLRAVAMGAALGFVLSLTNLYVGLKTAWFLPVGITACIVSFSLWTIFLGIGIAKTPMSILESNCMQTTASAAAFGTGGILASAFPALLLSTVSDERRGGDPVAWYIVAPAVLFIALFGVALAAPLKRALVNQERLKFPMGTATAITLAGLHRHGKEALAKGRALLVAALCAMAIPPLKDLLLVKVVGADGAVTRQALIPGSSNVFDIGLRLEAGGKAFDPSQWNIKLDHGLVLVGAGAVVGLRTTASMMAGALGLVLFIGPAAIAWRWTDATGALTAAATGPGAAWREIGVWYGAPLMLAYGLAAFAMEWRTLVRALSGLSGASSGRAARSPGVEVPRAWFVPAGLVAAAAIVALGAGCFGVPVVIGLLVLVITFLLTVVACRATGETGLTPSGAMGKMMQLACGAALPGRATASLVGGAVAAGAALSGGDLLNNLKAGYLLGASPRRQFVAQLCGVAVGTAASVLGYFLLVPDATALTGVPGVRDAAFAAPAAQQWLAISDVFRLGLQNLHPMARQAIVTGLAVGAALALLERLLPKHRSWIPSATGLGLGVMLPFYTPLAMFLGALLAWGFGKLDKPRAERLTAPMASGLIAGESLAGIVVAALNNFVLT